MSVAWAGQESQLRMACARGDVDAVRAILEKGDEDVDVTNDHGATPLHYASSQHENPVEILRLLLENKANVNKRMNNGQTALFLACQRGFEDAVELLLEHGADARLEDGKGETPLSVACETASKGIVQLLLNHGADPSHKDNQGQTPLQLAESRIFDETQESRAIVALLLEKTHPLHFACMRGDLEAAQRLLGEGKDVDEEDTSKTTPLSYACESGALSIVTLLLDRGADPNALNFLGYAPLHKVVLAPRNSTAIARLLLKYDADVDGDALADATPLSLALRERKLRLARLLLKSGADPEGSGSPAPLFEVMNNGYLDGLKLLLKAGVRPDPSSLMRIKDIAGRVRDPTLRKLIDAVGGNGDEALRASISARIDGYTTLSVVASLLGGFALSMLTAVDATRKDFDWAFYAFLACASITTCINLCTALVLGLTELSVKRMLGAPSGGEKMANMFLRKTVGMRSAVVRVGLHAVPLFVVTVAFFITTKFSDLSVGVKASVLTVCGLAALFIVNIHRFLTSSHAQSASDVIAGRRFASPLRAVVGDNVTRVRVGNSPRAHAVNPVMEENLDVEDLTLAAAAVVSSRPIQ